MEKIVIDLELAKKLKELGIKQESIFEYVASPLSQETHLRFVTTWDTCDVKELYSAFTTDELLETIPFVITHKETKMALELDQLEKNDNWVVCFLEISDAKFKKATPPLSDKKLPNTLAKLLIWCAENGCISL